LDLGIENIVASLQQYLANLMNPSCYRSTPSRSLDASELWSVVVVIWHWHLIW